MDFHSPLYAQISKALSGRRMLDFLKGLNRLHSRIMDPERMVRELSKPMDGHQCVFVDGGHQSGPTMLVKISWIVGAAPKKAYTKRCLANYHGGQTDSHC